MRKACVDEWLILGEGTLPKIRLNSWWMVPGAGRFILVYRHIHSSSRGLIPLAVFEEALHLPIRLVE